MQMMSTLSAKLNEKKALCRELSPKEIISSLTLKTIANEKCFQNCFDNEDFGISFLEYIISMHILYNFPMTLEGVCKMVNHSLYIYWDSSNDDIWQAAKDIDSSCLTGIRPGQNIYVGGLKSSSYELDVINTQDNVHILDISKPVMESGERGIDIANASRLEYNYISTCIFTDSIIHNIRKFNGLTCEEALDKYKSILNEKLPCQK